MSTTPSIISPEYGLVVATGAVYYLTQQLLAVIYVAGARKSTGIKAPTLYPRDSEIKALKLTDEQVHKYMCAQRAHQNQVEFTSVFLPLYLAAGLIPELTMRVFYCGVAVTVLKAVGTIGYQTGPGSLLRKVGGLFHVPELYLLYLVIAHGISQFSSVFGN